RGESAITYQDIAEQVIAKIAFGGEPSFDLIAVTRNGLYRPLSSNTVRTAIRRRTRKVEPAKHRVIAEWVRPKERGSEQAQSPPGLGEKKRKIENLELLGRLGRFAQSQQPLLHQCIVQIVEFDIEQSVRIIRLLERDGRAPNLSPVRIAELMEEIIETLDHIHICENQVDRESDLPPGHDFVEATPQYLCFLLNL